MTDFLPLMTTKSRTKPFCHDSSRVRRGDVVQHPIHGQLTEHDHLLKRQHRAAVRPIQHRGDFTRHHIADANDSQAWARSVSLSISGATTKIVPGA